MVPRPSKHGVSNQVQSSADLMSLDDLLDLSEAGFAVGGPEAMLCTVKIMCIELLLLGFNIQ